MAYDGNVTYVKLYLLELMIVVLNFSSDSPNQAQLLVLYFFSKLHKFFVLLSSNYNIAKLNKAYSIKVTYITLAFKPGPIPINKIPA